MVAQLGAQRANQEARQARKARHIGGSGGPSLRKVLNFRPSEIVSGAILG